ncbi:DUF4350 domain-containing protein [Streptomyces sp. NBC_01775]|uniref:DUF4350 domain-containing protein n=1 Tax=Streptomyces sp. NBC_01775 TaxID=2975939 RepID=UPI002DDA0D97|nr:DUF4350 domain-containing protein [Streptomyces sp. NBC_01775]WSB78796.1 DUF4350 domain-containing protein [Streptomyces sp. NBC_01775]
MSTSAPTSTSPTAQQVWRRARGLLLAAAILAVAGLTLAALRSGGEDGVLDPRSPAPNGSKAVSRLLSHHGVSTKILTSSAEVLAQTDPGTTLLVPFPDSLNSRQRKEIHQAARRSGRTVLLAPGPKATTALTSGVRTFPPTPVQPASPDCDFPAARRAGDTELGGFRYSANTKQADSCYHNQGHASLLHFPAPASDGAASTDTVLLGAPDPLYNERLDQHGNASLALQLLGARSQLLWYLPSASDTAPPEAEQRSFFGLIPSGWTWGAFQLAVAAALAVLWRARRLGPLVHEQLPVAVPAAEATEGRARLYRRANARGHAAEALRTASRSRLAALVGVPHPQAHIPEILIPALTGHSPAPPLPDAPAPDGPAVHALLFGPPPQNDDDLVQLADDLDRFEKDRISHTSASSPTDKDHLS